MLQGTLDELGVSGIEYWIVAGFSRDAISGLGHLPGMQPPPGGFPGGSGTGREVLRQPGPQPCQGFMVSEGVQGCPELFCQGLLIPGEPGAGRPSREPGAVDA